MGGELLQKLLSSVKANYGDDLARSIFSNYGDDVASRGSKSFLSRAMAGQADDVPKMIGYHGIPSNKFSDVIAHTDGKFINPSLQMVDPLKGTGRDYGDMVFIAKKELMNSQKPGINAFNRDVYSPRFPQVTDTPEGMIIDRTGKFASPDALSAEMNRSAIQGGEGGMMNNAQPGALAGLKAKKLKSIRDIVENSDNIQPYDVTREGLSSFSDDTANTIDKMADPYRSGSSNPYDMSSWDDGVDDLVRMFKGQRQHEMSKLSDEGRAIGDALIKRAKTLPTDYHETKITRPVDISEFAGVALPEGFDDPRILKYLEDAKMPIMGRYDPLAEMADGTQNSSLQTLLQQLTKGDRFKSPHTLGFAGGLLGGGSILGSLFGGNDNQPPAMS